VKPPFTSIRHPFAIDEGLGTLATENDYAEHVDQLVRQVLLTSPGERINRPDFGCGVKRMVFAPNAKVTAALTRVAIVEALNRWLTPVLTVSEVTVQALDETLEIRIAYALKARRENRYLNLQVTL
jgi:phage baseplate assembly protein W